jgi:hypothetical protein
MSFGTALGSVSLGAAFTLLCQQYAPSPLCRLGGSCVEHVGSVLFQDSSSDVCACEAAPGGWVQEKVHGWTHAVEGDLTWLLLLGIIVVVVLYEWARKFVIWTFCRRDGVQLKRRARRSVLG